MKGFVSQKEVETIKATQVDFSDMPTNFETDLVNNLKQQPDRHSRVMNDFRQPYFPSQNVYVANQGTLFQEKRFNIADLDMWMNYSVGVGYQATWGVSDDTVKNGFEFIAEPDKEDAKAVKRSKITTWMRDSGFLDMLWYWQSYNLGMGIGFSIGHWNEEMEHVEALEPIMKGFTKKQNIRHRKDWNRYTEDPPLRPPDRFEVLSPLFFMPTGSTLTKSNRLNYDSDLWEFTGGAINVKTKINKNRVFVLRTHEVSGYWRGLSTFDPLRYSLLGYFNNLIYVQRGIQNWGDMVMALFHGTKFPTVAEQTNILKVLNAYEMNGKIHLPENARLEPISVNIGRGIKDAMEIYVEDLAGKWRIPKNQLLGRSEGGGLTSGPAQISKDDYYERIGSDQRKLTHPIMKQFIWRFFPDTANLWLRWHMNVYKTDQQRILEAGMKLDNDLKELQLKKEKLELKALKEQRTMMLLDGAMKAREMGVGGNGEQREEKPLTKEDFIKYKNYIKLMAKTIGNGGVRQ